MRLGRLTRGAETTFSFDGVGVVVQGSVRSTDGADHVLRVDVFVDGVKTETVELPTAQNARRFVPFWKYDLPDGRHEVRLVVTNPTPGATMSLTRAIVYGRQPRKPAV